MVAGHALGELEQWLRDSRGYLNPRVQVKCDIDAGVHMRAQADLPANEIICTIPHSLALSSLNALVDDSFPVFRQRGLAVEAIGYFYLMHQYIHREASFWRPYLVTLPQPQEGFNSPFWFDDDDMQWLADTDVLQTTLARTQMAKDNYEKGIAMLQSANIDPLPYTWNLYKWAMTIFTSRSFSSRSLRPQDSKYWTAYKTGANNQRQTVLLDMSKVSAEDLDFPVLFPVLDVANHRHDARVDWSFDPGRFTLALQDMTPTGDEIFNNYGPKSNDQLLLGYGFCLLDNPHDVLLLTLKPPPQPLQQQLRSLQCGYFTETHEWSSEKATFGLHAVSYDPTDPRRVFTQLPEPLLELMTYISLYERGQPVHFLPSPITHLFAPSSLHSLTHITRMIVTSLAPKLSRLQASTPTTPPRNSRQTLAQSYRLSQIHILTSLFTSLRAYLRSLLYTPLSPSPLSHSQPILATLETILTLLPNPLSETFLRGLSLSTGGSTSLSALRASGWEDDLLILLLAVLSLAPSPLPSGLSIPRTVDEHALFPPPSDEELEHAASILALVYQARDSGDSEEDEYALWRDERWTAERVVWLLRFARDESFLMMLLDLDGESGEGAERPVLVVGLVLRSGGEGEGMDEM